MQIEAKSDRCQASVILYDVNFHVAKSEFVFRVVSRAPFGNADKPGYCGSKREDYPNSQIKGRDVLEPAQYADSKRCQEW